MRYIISTMRNKAPTILIATMLAVCLTGCSDLQNDDGASISYTEYSFSDLSQTFTLETENPTIFAYYLDEGNVPYVSVLDVLDELQGIFYDFSYVTSTMSNRLTITRGNYECVINWKDNTLTTSGYSFYYFIKSVSTVNYSHHLKTSSGKASKENELVLNLSDYGMDILSWKGLTLLPFAVFNSLFCSLGGYNIFFNGTGFYGASGESWVNDTEQYDTIKNGAFANTECPDDIREYTVNHFAWFMDSFYGLKSLYEIDTFKGQVTDEWYSNDPSVFTEAYYEYFFGTLDEGHTGINCPSVYADPEASYRSSNYYGERRTSIYSTRTELSAAQTEAFPEGKPIVEIPDEGDTAIIHFDSFSTMDISEVDESDPDSVLSAASSDTYYAFRYAMSQITNELKIKNVVVDLSTNGGGNTGALFRALGFLTNQDVLSATYNSLTKQYAIYYQSIDTNGDGAYDEKDGYPEYNWYVLTSNYTYSAANIFASTVKNMGIATTIGETSGGGMCSVMSTSLGDGTFFRFSSPNSYRYMTYNSGTEEYTFTQIETGVEPDHQLDRSKFYDLDAINEFVDGLGEV